jgi:hypothetical protein
MIPVLLSLAAGCYHFTGQPLKSLVLDPDACFAFFGANLQNITVNVTLNASPVEAFLGTDTDDAANLPHVSVIETSIPSTARLDMRAFMRPVPVLCSPAVTESHLSLISLPMSVITADEVAVYYELQYEPHSSAYKTQYEKDGNCINVVRSIPDLEESGLTVGECVGIIIGLLGGTALIAVCVIFLTSQGKKSSGDDITPSQDHADDGAP